jgi:Rieske Fe-S protein
VTGPGVSRRAALEVTGVALVAGAAGYVGFVALGPPPGEDDRGEDDHGDDDRSETDDRSGSGKGSRSLAAVDDIPDGGGLVLTEEKLVLTRDGASVRCFSAVCTHQGCLVGSVRDGEIRCPCHGSAFDAATGVVVHGPATEPLEREDVEVTAGGTVVRA